MNNTEMLAPRLIGSSGLLEHKANRTLNVLVACEYSGRVRDAFKARGHNAWSCDLLESESCRNDHIIGDVRKYLEPQGDGANRCVECAQTCYGDNCFLCGGVTISCRWDLMIAHPPCTHLAVIGARWFKDKIEEQRDALNFVRCLLDAPIPHIALENPVSIISSKIRKPDQVIQPWQHGHGETKATCLWLKNLPKLKPTNIVEGREGKVWKMPPSPDRWKARSRTYTGIAEAMADQWTLALCSNKD
jgi:site-specific DNA-cytosine methylase